MAPGRQTRTPVIDRFDIKPGRVLARKYEVIKLLGRGWEGEVYLVREHRTQIERAIKLFYPARLKLSEIIGQPSSITRARP